MKRSFLPACLLLILLAGCAGKRSEVPAAPDPVPIPETVPLQETAAQIEEETAFTYDPDPWTKTYISADPNIEADPSLLDSLTMTLPEGVTSHRASDCQIDFVKNGAQVGGIMLVEFPEGMLEAAAETMDGFEALADHLGKQVLSDIYPEEAYIHGGGAGKDGAFYLSVTYETEKRGKLFAGYWHRIYVGKEHFYDFWIDDAFWGDSGSGIADSLSGGDIDPERNKADFGWSFKDVPKTRRPFG